MRFVRQASIADMAQVGRVHSRAWRHDYTELLPPAALVSLEPELIAQQWASFIRHGIDAAMLLALDRDVVCGFLAFTVDRGVADIQTLVIDPDARGRGHASRLMSAFADTASSWHVVEATMWCPESDAGMQTFLTDCGWASDGATRQLEDPGYVAHEVRYRTFFDGGSPAPAVG